VLKLCWALACQQRSGVEVGSQLHEALRVARLQRANVVLELVVAGGAERGLHDCSVRVCLLHMLLVDCGSCCAVAF
jgi:hypothetical protein